MMTTKDLLVTLNKLRVKNGKKELAHWKQSRAKLDASIEIEQAEMEAKSQPETVLIDENQPEDEASSDLTLDENQSEDEASSDLTLDENQPEDEAPSDLTLDENQLEDEVWSAEPPVEKAPRGAIGNLVIELLTMTELPYIKIVEQVRSTYPSARTTTRSIASVALYLRRDGIEVPSRKTKKPKLIEA